MLFFLESKDCLPNRCHNGGTCIAVKQKKFRCDCTDTGFEGVFCEIGVLQTPLYPKLRVGQTSRLLALKARPSKKLKIMLKSSSNLQFIPAPPYTISYPQTQVNFSVKAPDDPGLAVVSYVLAGTSSRHFRDPEKSFVFTVKDVAHNENIYVKLGINKGTFPIGCNAVTSRTGDFSCPIKFLSTQPWLHSSRRKYATRGITHVSVGDQKPIPLSLIGTDLNDLSFDEYWNAKHFYNLLRIDMTQNDRILKHKTCFNLKLQAASISEIVKLDAMPISFLEAISERFPDWVVFKAHRTSIFHVNNIAASLDKERMKAIGPCSKFPVSTSSSTIYYLPVVNYTATIESSEASIKLNRDTCFAVDLCTKAVFWNVGETATQQLKLTKLLQNIATAGWVLDIRSVGFSNPSEKFIKTIDGNIKMERRFYNTSKFEHNLWIHGKVKASLGDQKMMKIVLEMDGEAFIDIANIETVSTAYPNFRSKVTQGLRKPVYVRSNPLLRKVYVFICISVSNNRSQISDI